MNPSSPDDELKEYKRKAMNDAFDEYESKKRQCASHNDNVGTLNEKHEKKNAVERNKL